MKVRTLIRCATTGALALSMGGATLVAQQPTQPVPTPARYDGGYLVFQSADSSFRYWLDGRLQIDGAIYTGSKNELANGTEVRRARLGGKATLYNSWHAELDIDFTKNAVDMKDMWLGYEGFKNSMIKIGNYKEPFSLETLTSSKYITFMERSYIDNFSPDRSIALGYVRWGNSWQVAVGAFGQPVGSVDASGRDEGHAFTGRFTFAPMHSEGRILHLGVGLSMRTPNGDPAPDTNTVRYRARPETNVSQARFLTTGKIRNVEHTSLYNGEFSMVRGPLTLQAEYTQADVNRLISLPTASFNGYYVSASYFLTGESRPYIVQEGEYDRVIPKSSRGAWEIAARYSTMDLNDTHTNVNINGGKGTNYTLGLNWHMNANFKWMLNYVYVVNDDNAKPDLGPVTPFTTGDKFSIIQTRFSVAF